MAHSQAGRGSMAEHGHRGDRWGRGSPITHTHSDTCSQLHELHCQQVYWRLQCMLSCSVMFNSGTPWTEAHQASLSVGFSRQEYWSGFPCPPPGDLPDQGLNPHFLHWQMDSLPLSHLESPVVYWRLEYIFPLSVTPFPHHIHPHLLSISCITAMVNTCPQLPSKG